MSNVTDDARYELHICHCDSCVRVRKAILLDHEKTVTRKTRRAKSKLKLYVWENVLRDYTAGIMFALARSPAHARKLLFKKCDYIPEEELKEEPRVVSRPEGIALWGGS